MTKIILEKLTTVTCAVCGTELYAEKEGNELRVSLCIACRRKFFIGREVVEYQKMDLAEAERRVIAHMLTNPELKQFAAELLKKEKKL